MNSIIRACIAEKTDASSRILKLGNAFLNGQQMSAPLGVYLTLSMPLYHSSRTFEFINTSPYNERAFILKSQNELLKLDSESRDIMSPSCIDKYINRPINMENISLIQFVANYNYHASTLTKLHKTKFVRFFHYNKFKDLENWAKEQILLHIPFQDEHSLRGLDET